MSDFINDRIRKRLATASLAFGANVSPFAEAATETLEILAEERGDVLPRERSYLSVLAVLSTDARASVRASAASLMHAAASRPDEAAELLQWLSRDPDPLVRMAAADGLAALLAAASPVARVELVCRWAVSEQAAEREAIARALSRTGPVLVADVAIEQLARDRLPRVRALAADAAAARYAEDPVTYRRILVELHEDPDEAVQGAARRGLQR